MRAASSSALAIAAAVDPPEPITPTTANCDAPVNTSSDMTIAWAGVSPLATANTPKEMPNTPMAKPSTRLAEIGSGGDGVVASGGVPSSGGSVTAATVPGGNDLTTGGDSVATMEPWELTGREQVRDLIARYTWAGDRGRFDDLVACFSEDGVLDVGDHGGRWVGRGEIARQLQGVAARVADQAVATGVAPGPVHHHVSSIQLGDVTEVEMSARSYFLVVTAVGVDHWGRYLDRFRRIADDWLFTERVVRVDGWHPASLMVVPGGASR